MLVKQSVATYASIITETAQIAATHDERIPSCITSKTSTAPGRTPCLKRQSSPSPSPGVPHVCYSLPPPRLYT
ncbi:hypothetical protein E2C01_007118 [Portunus trituberculatus]|uniref:Uncharacterized protein n=1 Tax=Portunus trituberculatus TaxID=210409 RepID=A0A5B7D028_PORTR|nr:hypothetical protein [Portunus trituberculatus]